MELNITKFFNEVCPRDYSASVAEIGANAGADTWRAACDDSADYMILDNDEKREAFRDFVRDSGGWNKEEIYSWSNLELNALLLQWIAGDIREAGLDDGVDWEDYNKSENAGRLFKGTDNEVYFYIGC